MIQKDVEPNLFEIIKNDIEEVHLAQWVDKINSHNHLDRRLLIFSDSGFALCRSKTFSKVPEITKFFSWFNLQSVELDDNIFKFSFNGDDQEGRTISFAFDQTGALLDVLCQHLVNILIPSEYPEISAGPNISIKNYSPIPMVSGISRLKANILYDNEENEEIRALIDSYTNFISSGMTKLNLGLFGDSQFIGLVIDSLNVVPYITSIVFPSTKNSSSHWNEFCDLLKNSKYIKEVTTHEQVTSDFSQISSIKHNEISKTIKSITFGNPGLYDDEVVAISNLYKKCGISSIKFIKTKNAMRSLRFNLNSFTANSNFKSITLDKISNINVLTTLRLFRDIEHVGITGCGIEISEAIPVICSLNGNINIKSINLSWNNSHYLLAKTNLSLPDCIEEMYFDNVKFRGVSLQPLLAFFECQKSPTKLAIHINNIGLDKEFYQSFFKFTQHYLKNGTNLRNDSKNTEKSVKCFNLNKIYFDNNQISKPLLQFFSKNEDLSFLSLNGSDFSSDDQIITELIQLVKRTKKLKELRITGNLRNQLPPEKLEKIIQSFAHDQRSIETLDISLHNYRPETLNVLADVLMMNRKIKYINFTRNNIFKKKAWQILFKKLIGRGTPLDFPLPQAEFCEMIRSKEIKIDEVVELMRLIQKIKKGNKEIKIPPESVNPSQNEEIEAKSATVDDDDNDDAESTEIESKNKAIEDKKSENKLVWEISEVPPPEIDNSNVIDSFDNEFGLNLLLEKSKT